MRDAKWKRLLRAARDARRVHEGQTRKHGPPYYYHPMAVARILWDEGETGETLLMAAYLHDALEDGGTLGEQVMDSYSSKVRHLVRAVTKQPGETLDRYYYRMGRAGQAAVRLKMADRQHNNSELHHMPADHPIHAKARAKTEKLKALARQLGLDYSD